jgi:hypothetical protein
MTTQYYIYNDVGVYPVDDNTEITREPDAIDDGKGELTISMLVPFFPLLPLVVTPTPRMSRVLKYLQSVNSITSIVFTPPYSAKGFDQFMALFTVNTRVKRLTLNFKLSSHHFADVAKALQQNRRVEHLTVAIDRDTALWLLIPVLSRHSSLKGLTFTGFLSQDVHKAIAAIITANTRLTTIDLQGAWPVMSKSLYTHVIATQLKRNATLPLSFLTFMLCLQQAKDLPYLPGELLRLIHGFVF